MILQKKIGHCLLHGVTGSGKTEIYLRLIAEVLSRGETAMFLVPEIGLTPLLSRLVVSRFPGQVSLLHSGMSAGERFDQWNRICEGKSRVVVGTRSAVFAPLKDLRLIVIDEEQDSSYKQDESPCYNAREVAWHRIQQSNGVLAARLCNAVHRDLSRGNAERRRVLFPSSGTDPVQADAACHHGGYERRV